MKSFPSPSLVRAIAALFVCFTTMLRAAPSDARLANDSVSLHDGGRVRNFVIARDEVGVIGADKRWRVQKVVPTADAEAVRQRAKQPDLAAAGKADLVLYEQGKPRTDANRRWLTARVLAKLRVGANAQAIATAVGAAAVEVPGYAPGYVLFTAPAGAGNGLTLADALSKRAEIESAEPMLARMMTKRFTPNDPFFADSLANEGYQWHLKNTGARGGTAGIDANVTTAWDIAKGVGVRIAIVDDGLELTHPDLAAHVDAANSYDYNDVDGDPSPGVGDDHGTACAGVAGAIGNNGLGVSGSAPEATLVGLRLISSPVTDADEAAAFTRRNDIIQIKSNSWGPADSGDVLEGPGLLASYAFQDGIANGRGGKGTLFFWAAGNGGLNDNSNFDGYANSIYTLAITAVGDDGVSSDYAEDGANILVSSPSDSAGRQGISTVDRTAADGYNDGTAPNYPTGDFTNDFGGTSSATPLAAGVGALMLQARPALTWRDVKEILIRTAKKNDGTDADWDANPVTAGVQNNGAGFHFNHKYGAGLIDAAAAVTMAQTWTLLPPMSSMTKSTAAASAIPDNNATGTTRTFTFAAAETLRVESVTVTVDITHPSRGELEVDLTSPSGTVSHLAPQRANDLGANLRWTLSSVRHWGESAVGVWSVTVKDRVATNTGTLNGVTLKLYGSGALVSGPPVITSAGTAAGPSGSFFSYQIAATQSPTSFAATGLPSGLVCNPVTGAITGTTTVQGVSSVTLRATNALGTGTLTLALTITASLGTLVAEAVDQPTLPFQTALPNAWFLQTTDTHDGADTAQSAAIADTQSSLFTLNVVGPKVASFWWKVSSEQDYDFLSFQVDGTAQESISGEVAWQKRSFFLPEGPHTLGWVYEKDGSGSAGLDAGFVDQMTVLAFEDSPPIITVQPTPLVVGVGGTAVFSVEALSAMPVTYQWLRNNVVIAGATSRVYLISAATLAGAGSYVCRVTNVNGAADSAPAILTVNAASPALANAVDTTLIMTTSGTAPFWARTTATGFPHDGMDAARATGLAVGDETTLSTTVVGPGTVTFWWRCDGEPDYDLLTFTVDGDFYDQISGGTAYTSASFYIPPGLHTLAWGYLEDQGEATNVVGRGLVDQLTFTASPFGTWMTANFTLQQRVDPSVSGANADPNRDGVTNLEAYAFSIHPITGLGTPLPRITQDGAELALIFRMSSTATDVTYFVESTTDLSDPFSWAEVSTTDVIIGTVGNLQTIEAFLPASENPAEFYRLHLGLTE